MKNEKNENENENENKKENENERKMKTKRKEKWKKRWNLPFKHGIQWSTHSETENMNLGRKDKKIKKG